MSRAITLTLPDEPYKSIWRNAQATNQPLATLLLSTLRVSLSSLEGVPADTAADLVRLEALDSDVLRVVVHEGQGGPTWTRSRRCWRGTGTGRSPTSSTSAWRASSTRRTARCCARRRGPRCCCASAGGRSRRSPSCARAGPPSDDLGEGDRAVVIVGRFIRSATTVALRT